MVSKVPKRSAYDQLYVELYQLYKSVATGIAADKVLVLATVPFSLSPLFCKKRKNVLLIICSYT